MDCNYPQCFSYVQLSVRGCMCGAILSGKMFFNIARVLIASLSLLYVGMGKCTRYHIE